MPFKLKIIHGKWVPLVKGFEDLIVQGMTPDTKISQLKLVILEANKTSAWSSLIDIEKYFFNSKASLTYGGKVLDNDMWTLSDYGVSPGSFVAYAHWYAFNVPLSKYKKQIFKKAFDEYDTDGSGEMDAIELSGCMRGLGMSRTEQQCITLVDQVDDDLSGQISFEEFCLLLVQVMTEDGEEEMLAMISKRGELNEQDQRKRDSGALIMHITSETGTMSIETREGFQKAFNDYDADGSGEIDAGELSHLMHGLGMERTEDECRRMVDKVDDDGSGEIGFDEFIELCVGVMDEDEKGKAAMLAMMETKKESKHDREIREKLGY